MIYYQTKSSGFSLVETLVAISILLIVITGPMAISMRTAKSSSFSSEQIQAFFFAQEGLELAQKARDEYLLQYFNNSLANPWQSFSLVSGTYASCFTGSGCGLQWGSAPGALANPTSCNPVGNCLLYRKLDPYSDRDRFSHSAAQSAATIFTRRIYFTAAGTDGVKVRSSVTWRTGSIVADQIIEVDTYLYNVYDTP